MNIIKGIQKKPVKVVIYGPEGIGKSTLASQFPDPLFIDTENGTARLDVRRVVCTESWTELLSNVREVKRTPDICKTLVIDTADWAERLCIDYICQRDNKKNGIEDYGYGKGYTYLVTEFGSLLGALNDVVAAGINVVVTAHAAPRKYELPEAQGQYDTWAMKLTKQVAPLLREWSDALLFCNYETFTTTTADGKVKATGGKKRMIYCNHSATYDAKNRFNLPDELPMTWSSIAGILDYGGTVASAPETKPAEPAKPVISGIDTAQPKQSTWHEKLHSLLEMEGITEDELMEVTIGRGKAHEGDTVADLPENRIAKWVYPNWETIKNNVINNRNKEK